MIHSVSKKKKGIIGILLLMIIMSACYFYNDSRSVIRFGINFWDALFSGRFFDIAAVNNESFLAGQMTTNAGYGIITSIILAIWQFPLYIIECICKSDILDFFLARVWGKAYFIVALFLCASEVKKVAKLVCNDEGKSKLAYYMFLLSSFSISSVIIVGQVDVFGVYLSLLAIRYLFENNEKKFVIFYLIASQCKYFPMFYMLPMILLYEKKIKKIIMYAVSPVILSWLLALPFKLLGGASFDEENVNIVINIIMGCKIEFAGQKMPLLIVLFCGVCIWAYLKNVDISEQRMRYSLYFGMLGIISVFTLFACPYRVIYLVPFVILIMLKEKANTQDYILEALASFSLLIGIIAEFRWCYDVLNMKNMLIDIILPLRKFDIKGIDHYYFSFLNDSYNIWSIPYAIFTAWLVVFIVRFYPRRRDEYFALQTANSEFPKKSFWIGRGILSCIIPLIAIILYIIAVINSIYLHFFG